LVYDFDFLYLDIEADYIYIAHFRFILVLNFMLLDPCPANGNRLLVFPNLHISKGKLRHGIAILKYVLLRKTLLAPVRV